MQNLHYVGKRFPKIFGENGEKLDSEISCETNESRKLRFFFCLRELEQIILVRKWLWVFCATLAESCLQAGHGRIMLSAWDQTDRESLFLSSQHFAWGTVLQALDHTNADPGGVC